jgi:hypothetical protein
MPTFANAALLALSLGGFAPAQSLSCDSTRALRVLFIGNSFTYVHNVPRLVEAIAASLPGACITTAMVAIGGATLEQHWSADSVVRKIRSGGWTHIVLNDQSTFGEGWWLEGRPRIGTSGRELAEYASRFVSVIREAQAKPVILAHWVGANAPPRDEHALDYIFSTVARSTGSALAPAGRAVKRVQRESPFIDPYFTDRHHLSAAGAYLEALVLYTALTDQSPVGAAHRITGPRIDFNRGTVFADSIVPLVDLSARDADNLQRAASSVQAPGELSAPPPLSTEFPNLPPGCRTEPSDLSRLWRGTTRALPNPANETTAIELRIGQAGGDSLFLRAGPLSFAGVATVGREDREIVVRSAVRALQPTGRGPALPLDVVLRATICGGVMNGVAKIEQRYPGSLSSFDAIGRFEAR